MASLLNNLVFYFLCGEVLLLLLLLLPMPGSLRRVMLRWVASSRLLAAIAQPLSYLAFAVVAMFVMVTREMLAHQAAWAERKREPADKAGLGLGVSSLEVRMLRSQRNWYLSGFACVLMLVIWRVYGMVKEIHALRDKPHSS